MPVYQIFKETALPGSLEAHSIYLIAPAARPDFVEMYVTGASPTLVKRALDQPTVQAMIDAAVAAGSGGAIIVDTIAERNAIATPQNAQQVYVVDASADPTVASGGATYIYRLSNTTWIKQSEAESLDLSLAWANITGRPTSTTANIDLAVTQRHTHANKTELDKIGQDVNGDFTYEGELPKIAWSSTGW